MSISIIESASVKVMRSFDYCHFEVALTSTLAMTPEGVDDLRKEAARLADKAVEQYKIAKRAADLRNSAKCNKWQLETALDIPEKDRSPEQKAIIKYHQDAAFAAQFEYDYQDDWEEPTP